MKNLLFLLSIMTGIVQDAHCDTYSILRKTIACCSCGRSLTADDIQLNLSMHKDKNQFICEACRIFLRGGEDGELILIQSPTEKFESAVTSAASSAHFFSDSDGWVPDHFYENKEARKLIDDATWELSSADVKKTQKMRVGRNQHKVFFKTQKPKKKKTASYLDSGVHSPVVQPFPFPDVWLYTFPKDSEIQPYSYLQVLHGDQLFISASQSPACELWCQGSRAVVVTEDGYTYFDIQKQQRFFFTQKQDLDAHMATQGFTSEFKVLIKDGHPVVHVADGDSALDKIFSDHKARVEADFAKRDAEYEAGCKEINEKYNALIQGLTDNFSSMTAS